MDIACDNLMQRMQQGCVSKNCFLVCPWLHETALPSTIEIMLWQQKLLKISGHNGPQESLKDDTRCPHISRVGIVGIIIHLCVLHVSAARISRVLPHSDMLT